jgi:hypothetical protein
MRCRTLLSLLSFLIFVHAVMDIVSFPYASSLGPAYAARHPVDGLSATDPVPPFTGDTRSPYRWALVLTFLLSFPAGIAVGAFCTRRRLTRN